MASGDRPDEVFFPEFESGGAIRRLGRGEALPDRLAPGETLILDLPGFAPGLLTVGVATMGGEPDSGPPPHGLSRHAQAGYPLE